MKKLGKFIVGTLAFTSLVAGAYYLYKNFIKKDSGNDFEDFEDDFEDADSEPEEETREYVPLNISPEVNTAETSEEDAPAESEDEDDAINIE